MRLRFWQWVYDKLEDCCHWVCYNKIARTAPNMGTNGFANLSVEYLIPKAHDPQTP